jgi:hypothetical protein
MLGTPVWKAYICCLKIWWTTWCTPVYTTPFGSNLGHRCCCECRQRQSRRPGAPHRGRRRVRTRSSRARNRSDARAIRPWGFGAALGRAHRRHAGRRLNHSCGNPSGRFLGSMFFSSWLFLVVLVVLAPRVAAGLFADDGATRRILSFVAVGRIGHHADGFFHNIPKTLGIVGILGGIRLDCLVLRQPSPSSRESFARYPSSKACSSLVCEWPTAYWAPFWRFRVCVSWVCSDSNKLAASQY